MSDRPVGLNAHLRAVALAQPPDRHPFFRHLSSIDLSSSDHSLMEQLYVRYQSAMHATRVMAYHLPYLDDPVLRSKKIKILADDDLTEHACDSHHSQVKALFVLVGPKTWVPPTDGLFSELHKLTEMLDQKTASFVEFVVDEYPKSLGAWFVVETLADNWIQALVDGLSVMCPAARRSRYAVTNLDEGIERTHAAEALAILSTVLKRRPELVAETVASASRMSEMLNVLWQSLDDAIGTAAPHRLRA